MSAVSSFFGAVVVPVTEGLALTRNKIVVWDEERPNNPFYSLYAYWHRPMFKFARTADDPLAWEYVEDSDNPLFNWTPYIESVFAFLNERAPEHQELFIFDVDEYNAVQVSDELRFKPDLDYVTLERFKQDLYGQGLLRVAIEGRPCTLIEINAVLGIYFSELRRGHMPVILLPHDVLILAVDGRTYADHIFNNAERYPPDDTRYLEAHSTLATLWSALQGLDTLYFSRGESNQWDLMNFDVDKDLFTKQYMTGGPFKAHVDKVLEALYLRQWYNPLICISPFPHIKISHLYLAWLCGSEGRPHDFFCFDATAEGLTKTTPSVVDVHTRRVYYQITSRAYINLKDSFMLFFEQPCFDRLYDREDLFLEGDINDEDDDRVREENLLIAEISTKLNF